MADEQAGGARERPLSPCTRVCTIAPSSGLCLGCLRTLDEIARWGGMSAAEREAVWQALATRAAS